MEFISKLAEGFMSLFTAGGETFMGWVSGIIPMVVCLMTFVNSIIKLVGTEKVEAFAKENGLEEFTIQGEFCGPGIQRNRLKLAKPEWYVFTIRENGKRVGLSRMLEICKTLGLEHVPIEEVGMDLPSKYPTVEALLERADGDYPKGGKKEGIVIRPTEPVFCDIISASLSMKVVSNKYLLKNEE